MMETRFGQVVLGPPGSGKTTYCKAMASLLQSLGRKVAVINLGELLMTGAVVEFLIAISLVSSFFLFMMDSDQVLRVYPKFTNLSVLHAPV